MGGAIFGVPLHALPWRIEYEVRRCSGFVLILVWLTLPTWVI